ncbi:MAG: hypothetical protein A2504_02990 [Bdellovibrionales bacterium RIFOXYD12_FULL_39_22]|nr:MAG: hypothetical protein A2385_05705 [Bdellovibrionales bacterium RIFOXYB1_FULL_39_21]OFZ42248.1 MAG: hypothetical protein A2485_15735 [Bdellovibrionales bacterium RIFOXYC12_FULL_39_17]OFZ46660.1 MAG: hypothetical protein A2404_03935 [Bdellovibrionales bacterium RIFOXYC1_FULL_39_130]OFZ75414.1 MAG: hypothetical protein A2451_09035 [Bdellovibrionales bacterium RIFOXYC2_FULL_39_8]OFZ76063.1 MAG: hypothetical protein A2560_03215 [Bdellovibrionales bacterium RIFOXYD1_FULL_39_84]OFZ93047.1 MAG:
MKKGLALLVLVSFLLGLQGCGSNFKAQRVSADESDEKALEITDKWIQRDTENAIKDVLQKFSAHKGLQRYLGKLGRQPKLFISSVQNETSEAYFPIDDMNDKLLDEFSSSGDYILIDAAARDKILAEITYQNDGMVDPAQAKMIGKQSGADILIFGAVRMKPEARDGKTLKQYSVNLRMTNLETAEEVCRVRFEASKYSEQKGSGW